MRLLNKPRRFGCLARLYKTLTSTYGPSLARKTAPLDDPVWLLGWSEDLQAFREHTLDALQQTQVYFMNHMAADYADTLPDEAQDNADERKGSVMEILGKIVRQDNVFTVGKHRRSMSMKVTKMQKTLRSKKRRAEP